jgi:hypothetical protein
MTLPHMCLLRLQVGLRFKAPTELPVHKGSLLRGQLGYTLRRMVCAQPERKHCVGCLLQHNCAYGVLFEPSPPPDAEALSKNEAVPRPFVIEPSDKGDTQFAAGDWLDFGVVLVGRAIDHLPYFVLAFEELGRRGLGRPPGAYTVEEVLACSNGQGRSVVYAGGEMYGLPAPTTTNELATQADNLPPHRLHLRFLTPTRLVYRKQPVENPPFHVLVRRLLDRVSSLSYFHCGQRWETDFRGLIAQAQEVELAACDTRWENVERYSGRQRARLSLGGFVGDVTYQGDLAPFRELLVLGSLVHVGKATVFGNGRYELVAAR